MNIFTSWVAITWSWEVFVGRLKVIFRSGETSVPFKVRVKLFLGILLSVVMLPVMFTLWTIDEIFYGAYRKMNVDDVIWIVSSPRTGSTTLVDALLKNDRDFISPSHVEAVFPFICVNRLIDGVIYFFGLFGVDLVAALEKLVKRGTNINDDVVDHHPMELLGSTQPEVINSLWLGISPAVQYPVPDVEYLSKFALMTTLDESTYFRMHALRKALLQKVAYRRGNGRRIVFKGHFMEDLPRLVELFPKCTVILGNRRPSDQIPSVLELCHSLQMARSGVSAFQKHFIDARLELLDVYFNAELNFMKNPPKREVPLKTLQVPFKKFIANPDVVVKEMYALCGIEYEGDKYLEKVVEEILEETRAYKGKRKYKNPPLSFFGLEKDELDKKYAEYIKFMGL